MNSTLPIFILGSGRSGTFQMVKLLETINQIEAHHEYLFENLLKPAVLYRMGLEKKDTIKGLLSKNHAAAIHYSKANYWVDSSNALPWIIEPLKELFPSARFIHLLRDGRKVVSSFFNKFDKVMYEDRSVSIVNAWLADPIRVVEPPGEKKYWRPLPKKSDSFACEFEKYDQFDRICYYWQDCNLHIKSELQRIPAEQVFTFHLEKIVNERSALEQFLAVFNVIYEDRYLDFLRRPVNVHIPKNFLLSKNQKARFNSIAGGAMKVFGYDHKDEYNVEY